MNRFPLKFYFLKKDRRKYDFLNSIDSASKFVNLRQNVPLAWILNEAQAAKSNNN